MEEKAMSFLLGELENEEEKGGEEWKCVERTAEYAAISVFWGVQLL